MKRLLVIALALCALGMAPLKAEAVDQDMAQISCKEFLADRENMPMMLMWMDGYMSGKSDNTTMSYEWIEKLGTHLGKFCSQSPNKTIMDAMYAMEE